MEITVQSFDQLSARELFRIYQLRVAVFVVEQNCAYQEVDSTDLDAYHICLKEDQQLLAYCRIYQDGNHARIGRVISAVRHKGYGRKVMTEAIKLAEDIYHADTVVIEAQLQARSFYEKLGFIQTSAPFDDAGITHIEMKLAI